jgi:hypothetical protein
MMTCSWLAKVRFRLHWVSAILLHRSMARCASRGLFETLDGRLKAVAARNGSRKERVTSPLIEPTVIFAKAKKKVTETPCSMAFFRHRQHYLATALGQIR